MYMLLTIFVTLDKLKFLVYILFDVHNETELLKIILLPVKLDLSTNLITDSKTTSKKRAPAATGAEI